MEGHDTNLINRLDIIAKDRAFIRGILEGRLSRAEQEKRVRSLLPPAELGRYDAGMRMIGALGKIRPEKPKIVDLEDARNLPAQSAEAVKRWLQDNADEIRVYGSFVDWVYAKGLKGISPPRDIDIAAKRPYKAAKELAQIIGGASGHRIEVLKYSEPMSYTVDVIRDSEGKIAVDIHRMEDYEKRMPYDWKIKPSIKIDGIPFEQLGEQLRRRGMVLLNPGIGIEGRGMIGPRASQMSWREKDMPRMYAIGKALIKEARRQGKDEVARKAEKDLRILLGKPTKPYPKVVKIKAPVGFEQAVVVGVVRKRKRKHQKRLKYTVPMVGSMR